MKLIFFRLFYCIFKGLKRSYREDDKTVTIISSIHLSILVFLNVFFVLFLITAISGTKAYQLPIVWLLIVLPILNCRIFLQKKKYQQIIELFDKEDDKTRKKRKTLCVVYIVLSLISFPAMLYLIGRMGLYG